MGNKYNNCRKQFENAPEDLHDHIFYGLTLDPDQEKFRDAIYDKDNIITICDSKAGCGKTTIALGVAALMVEYGRYNGIVYIVSPTMEQKQGFLPGDVSDKTAPYMEPLLNAMNTLGIPESALITEDNIKGLKEGTAYIEFIPHTFMRGTNLENKVVILDEFQNYYDTDGKKVLTRIHDSCKVIVIGHTEQCDLYKNPHNSAFKKYLDAFSEIKDDPRVAICKLTVNHRGWLSTFCDNVQF